MQSLNIHSLKTFLHEKMTKEAVKSWATNHLNRTAILEFLKNNSFLLLYATICGFSFFLLQKRYSLGANLLFICLYITGWLFSNYVEKAIYVFFLISITILDYHFYTHYHARFQEVGKQALVSLQITDKDEVISYILGLHTFEVILYVFFFLALLSILFLRLRYHRISFPKYLRIVPLLILAVGLYFQAVIPLHDFLIDWKEMSTLYKTRAEFQFNAKDERPDIPQHVFLVVGETHRQDHFDLLVDKEFAPFLHELNENSKLLSLDDVISCYQTTYFSLFSLLTRRPTDNQKIFFQEKGILDLFHEAGYTTIYMTYNEQSLENDGFNAALKVADKHIDYRHYGKGRLDRLMIPICKDLSETYKDQKTLVVIKMIGAHFFYQDRYTEETRRYNPSFAPHEKVRYYDISMKEKIDNTYKNAVLESAVCLNGISEVVAKSQTPSMFFFISDHGATNYDDGENDFIGCAEQNYHIPAFFYFNDAFEKNIPGEKLDNLKKNANSSITNSYIFDTLVSIAGISYPDHRGAMDLTSSEFKENKDRHIWKWNEYLSYGDLKKSIETSGARPTETPAAD